LAKLFHQQGDYEILAVDAGKLTLDPEGANQLVKTAGTTCYQSADSTQKSPGEFVKMLKTRKHFAMTEFGGWPVAKIEVPPVWQKEVAGGILLSSRFLYITERKEGSLLVSGNPRAWNEAYAVRKDPHVKTILRFLSRANPVLYDYPAGSDGVNPNRVMLCPALETPEEILTHRAMIVRFNNCSRGFTHEDVRHRVYSFGQESTRYVKYDGGMLFILPYREYDEGLEIPVKVKGGEVLLNTQEIVDLYESVYRGYRNAGYQPQEARQWLPIGIKSQIVQMSNLAGWRHWFFLRCARTAHPEIRHVACRLLEDVQGRVPGIFDDFEIYPHSEDGSLCAKSSHHS